jgi:small ligand-binding sensory domain FIST
MSPFIVGHATHPEWSGALALVTAQIEAQLQAAVQSTGSAPRMPPAAPTLGFVYCTDAYVDHADALLAGLRRRWPSVAFVGTVGVGVAASDAEAAVEYFDEPALVVMLAALPRSQFQLFNGRVGLRGAHSPAKRARLALVHADPGTPDLPDLLSELADRTESGYLFGGVSASRTRHVQWADGVFQGGLSGVAFGAGVDVVSRVTQGCTPVGPPRRITACDGTVVLALDGQPALPQLFADLQLEPLNADAGHTIDRRALRDAVPRMRRTLVGLTESGRARGSFGEDVRVRHLIGIDPTRQGIAVAEVVRPGMGLSFCERDVKAARRDLVRVCTEIRDEVESRADAAGHAGRAAPRMLGALYVSCSGRGGPHFGGPSAELQVVRHALGEVPLAGFFAAGEIAHRQLHGYTGVLTVFVGD